MISNPAQTSKRGAPTKGRLSPKAQYSRNKINAVWHHLKHRCYNSSDKSYPNYGGRGIDVCPEWQRDFESFYRWAIESGWRLGLQIDRIDNDKGYSPTNCRFVTRSLNCRNRRLTAARLAANRNLASLSAVGRAAKFQRLPKVLCRELGLVTPDQATMCRLLGLGRGNLSSHLSGKRPHVKNKTFKLLY